MQAHGALLLSVEAARPLALASQDLAVLFFLFRRHRAGLDPSANDVRWFFEECLDEFVADEVHREI